MLHLLFINTQKLSLSISRFCKKKFGILMLNDFETQILQQFKLMEEAALHLYLILFKLSQNQSYSFYNNYNR